MNRLVRAVVVVAAVHLAVVAPSTIGSTEAAWRDTANTVALLQSSRWGVGGNALAGVGSASLGVTVLATGIVAPLPPIVAAHATPAAPGPITVGPSDSSVPGLAVGLVGASVSLGTVEATARYAPTSASASTTAVSTKVGLSALGLALLSDVAMFTSASGAMHAAATCPATGAPTTDAVALDQVRVSLLGALPLPLDPAGTLASTQLTALNLVRVSVSVAVTRHTTTTPAPAVSASAGLGATITVAVEQRASVVTPFGVVLGATVTVGLADATCALSMV